MDMIYTNSRRIRMMLLAVALAGGSAKGQVYVNGSVYGGGNVGNVAGNTTVNLTSGTINDNVYGGGKGDATTAATVGSTQVNLNQDVENTAKGCIVLGSIFGCNNINGTPLGDATVHIFKTQNVSASQIGNPAEGEQTAKMEGHYDVTAVYGGGNLAAYMPTKATNGSTDDDEEAFAHVIIEGCDLTSIKTVYGGGNAASTPATKVEIKGTYEIEEVFGGGNGKDNLPNGDPNPGANVGYKAYPADADYATRNSSEYTYGSGKASVTINGGRIHRVYGGSNTKGNVRQIAVALLEELQTTETIEGVEVEVPECTFNVDEAYGGGKSAPMDGEARLEMECIPGLKVAYGGAQNADISNSVTLNITNGTFERVFGGNNEGGRIMGSITVNIEETGCQPIIIGELYGGGNQAAYSVWGYKEVTVGEDDNGTTVWDIRQSNDDGPAVSGTPYADPQVNVKSFSSIGSIFGGAYGEQAVMVGNPQVNINEILGLHNDKVVGNESKVIGTKVIAKGAEGYNAEGFIVPEHTAGTIGTIGTVFGGGNAADVIGNTFVNIGTAEKVSYVTGTDHESQNVQGANITGNVYGGGNKAKTTGNTNVTIGKQQ